MNTIQFDFLLNQLRNVNGVIQGGYVNFYEPSTTTDKAVYADANGTILLDNPVPLNIHSACTVYGELGALYRVQVLDATQTPVAGMDWNNIVLPSRFDGSLSVTSIDCSSTATAVTFVGALQGNALTATTAGNVTNLPAGSIVQVVSGTKIDTFSTTSLSPTDVTGTGVDITPKSASNKILVIAHSNLFQTAGSVYAYIRLMRDSTLVGNGTNGYFGRLRDKNIIYNTDSFTVIAFDTPNTTSQINYHLEVWGSSGQTIEVNKYEIDVTSITLLEVQG